MNRIAFLAALVAAGPALAQGGAQGGPRPAGGPALPPFQCVGAENLEEDVFEVPFPAASDRVGDAARTPLALAAELLKREPDRNACILGHARREGGQQTSVNLAARRARAVREALMRAGIPDARLRSEARVAGFSRTTANAVARSVSIVVMPVSAPRPERVPAARPAPDRPAMPAAPGATPAAPATPPAGAPAAPPPATPPAAPPPVVPIAPPAVTRPDSPVPAPTAPAAARPDTPAPAPEATAPRPDAPADTAPGGAAAHPADGSAPAR